MRVLVTGSRDWGSSLAVCIVLAEFLSPGDTLVHGGARGVDTIAAQFAEGLGLAVEAHPADWVRYGKRAGYVRNKAMVDAGADVCVAFIKNGSRGATMCASIAEKAGIPTYWFREGEK